MAYSIQRSCAIIHNRPDDTILSKKSWPILNNYWFTKLKCHVILNLTTNPNFLRTYLIDQKYLGEGFKGGFSHSHRKCNRRSSTKYQTS